MLTIFTHTHTHRERERRAHTHISVAVQIALFMGILNSVAPNELAWALCNASLRSNSSYVKNLNHTFSYS